MNSIVGIFTSRAQAESAATQLKSIGIKQENLNLLTPTSTEKEIHSVPVSEAEQPGMGRAVGGLVGGAIGTAGGLSRHSAMGRPNRTVALYFVPSKNHYAGNE